MLPDFPDVKTDLSEQLVIFLKARVDHHLGPLSKIARVRFFEGDRQELIRASGEAEPSGYEEIRSGFGVRDEELPDLTLDALLMKLDQAAEELAQQMGKGLYTKISEAVERVGNVVDAKGRKLEATMILELLSSIDVDFNQDGTPRLPEIHIHPTLSEGIQLAAEEFERRPDLKQQFKEIIDQKREDWRAREASRKLVG
ncbi:MAG: hypothetical protein ACREA0_02025 [bacterium]